MSAHYHLQHFQFHVVALAVDVGFKLKRKYNIIQKWIDLNTTRTKAELTDMEGKQIKIDQPYLKKIIDNFDILYMENLAKIKH